MLQSFAWKAAKHIREAFACYLLLLFLFIAGIIAGIVANGAASAAQHEALKSQLSQFAQVTEEVSLNRASIFWSAYLNYLLLLAIALICVFYMPGLIIAPLLLVYRGFLLGYGSGALMAAFGFKGFILSAWMQMVPSCILLLCMLPLCVDGLRNAWAALKGKLLRRGKPPPARNLQECLSMALIAVVLFVFAALWDAFLAPALLFLLA